MTPEAQLILSKPDRDLKATLVVLCLARNAGTISATDLRRLTGYGDRQVRRCLQNVRNLENSSVVVENGCISFIPNDREKTVFLADHSGPDEQKNAHLRMADHSGPERTMVVRNRTMVVRDGDHSSPYRNSPLRGERDRGVERESESVGDHPRFPECSDEINTFELIPSGGPENPKLDAFDAESGFAQFWDLYRPLRSTAKARAREAYRQVIERMPSNKTLASQIRVLGLSGARQRHDRLMDGVRALQPELSAREPETRPYGSSFIRSGDWLTEEYARLPKGLTEKEFIRVYREFREKGLAATYGKSFAWTPREQFEREAPIREAIIKHREEYAKLYDHLTKEKK